MKYYFELFMAVMHGPETSSKSFQESENKRSEKTLVRWCTGFLATHPDSWDKSMQGGGLWKILPWEEVALFRLESPPSLGDLPQFN